MFFANQSRGGSGGVFCLDSRRSLTAKGAGVPATDTWYLVDVPALSDTHVVPTANGSRTPPAHLLG